MSDRRSDGPRDRRDPASSSGSSPIDDGRSQQAEDRSGPQYSADRPAPPTDDLHRRPFAMRLARSLARRTDPQGVVVGVYGAWGEGKSTMLEYLVDELQKASHIICVRFNPWLYNDYASAQVSFFQNSFSSTRQGVEDQKGTSRPGNKGICNLAQAHWLWCVRYYKGDDRKVQFNGRGYST